MLGTFVTIYIYTQPLEGTTHTFILPQHKKTWNEKGCSERGGEEEAEHDGRRGRGGRRNYDQGDEVVNCHTVSQLSFRYMIFFISFPSCVPFFERS